MFDEQRNFSFCNIKKVGKFYCVRCFFYIIIILTVQTALNFKFFIGTYFTTKRNGGEEMNKNKKEYIPADVTLIEFDKNDVITTSSWGLPYVDPNENAWV